MLSKFKEISEKCPFHKTLQGKIHILIHVSKGEEELNSFNPSFDEFMEHYVIPNNIKRIAGAVFDPSKITVKKD